MQIFGNKINVYDHSNLINNPPYIEISPYMKKLSAEKKFFDETYFEIYKTYENKYKNTDKYMWCLVIGSFSTIGLSFIYIKRKINKVWQKIFKK